MIQDYLEIDEPLVVDNSVAAYTFHEYNPIVGTNLNNVNSEIRIVLENQDAFTHPSKSYLLVKGKLVKTDGAVYADADVISLVNNGIMFLFNNIKYHLADKLVDELNYPGYATTLKGLLSYSGAEQASALTSCWALDSVRSTAAHLTNNVGFGLRHSAIITQTSPKGTFSFLVPVTHMLGFFEDYNKIVYGVKQTLTLMRTANADAIFKANAADDGKVVLTDVSWVVPHVTPSDEQKLKLYKLIDGGKSVDLGFRHWHYDSCDLPQSTNFTWRLITTSAMEKPRWIVLSFQTSRHNDAEKNPAVFDHCSLSDCHAMLNSERYPFLDLNLNFSSGDYATLFRMFCEFRKSYYDSTDTAINPLLFKAAYPLVVIDCTKQNERLQNSVVDVQLKMRFANAVAAGTRCHALLIGDRKMQLKLDRGKVDVVY